MVLAIVLGEVTLILSMQRGAWLTYPPTLLLFWVIIFSGILMVDTYKGLRARREKIDWWTKRILILFAILLPIHIVTIYPIKMAIIKRFV
jgi:hypothetical protein